MGVDLLQRRVTSVERCGDVLPALLVEIEADAPDLSLGLVKPARGGRPGGVGDDLAQRARERLASEAGRQLRPLLGVEPRARYRAVGMLERAAALLGAHQFDAAEVEQYAHVVGDVAQWRVEQLGELLRTCLAASAQPLEDALAQGVRERLSKIRIERPILSGIRAGSRHPLIEHG